ncbi:unnamed protein product, partial [Ceratitis capitata]
AQRAKQVKNMIIVKVKEKLRQIPHHLMIEKAVIVDFPALRIIHKEIQPLRRIFAICYKDLASKGGGIILH